MGDAPLGRSDPADRAGLGQRRDTADLDLVIGQIGPPRGIHGDLFVKPWTDDPDERFAPGSVLRTEPAEVGPLTVTATSGAGGKRVVHFVGVDDRPGAEALRGVRLVIEASERPALDDPDEFYDTDLIGLEARTVDGSVLGPVTDVVHAGMATYLVVSCDGRDVLVPFVIAIVPTVDLTTRSLVVDPPEGLLEL